MRFRTCFLFSFLLFTRIVAQQYRMDHFGLSNGLSQNTVNCILRDNEGYYWFGTQDGLNRYDGYSIKTFRNDRSDTNSISDNFILNIIEDDWGNLWIGTRNGLNHYNKTANIFTRVWMDVAERKEYHNSSWNLFKDAKGDILLNQGRVSYGRIDRNDSKEPPFHVNSTENVFFYSGANDLYMLQDLKKGKSFFKDPSGKVIGQMAMDTGILLLRRPFTLKDQDIYFGENALFLLAKGASVPVLVHAFKDDQKISALLTDKQKRIWIGTNKGLYVIEKNGEEPRLLLHDQEDRHSLSSNAVENLYEDPDGIIWIGTSEGGVNLYDPERETFKHINRFSNPSLPSEMVWSIWTNDRKMYVGTNNGTLEYDVRKNPPEVFIMDERKTGDKVVTCFAKDALGNIWLGTKSNGVSVMNKASGQWTHYKKELALAARAVVSQLYCDKEGDMWISTQAGLYCYKKGTQAFEFFAPDYKKPGGLPSAYIFGATQDKQGFIWVGSANGLFRYDKAKTEFRFYQTETGVANSLSYNMVTSIFQDSKDRLWICTLGGGIDLYDRQKETFTSFTTKQGLSNDVTYAMLEDYKGYLWVSTNGGLSCFDPEKKIFRNFGVNEGVISNEFTTNAAFKDEEGKLYFGSPEGLVIFDPAKINDRDKKIPVVLTDLRINYRNVAPSKEIDLFYNDRTISFEFAAIDWRCQNKIGYSFKLEGFDAQWNDVSSSVREASYSNLPFGDYTFRVRVKVGNGMWQESGFAIPLHVIPPFWLRTWFIVLESIAALLLLFLLVRYYAQRKLKARLREIELQHKVQMERERISRDLHDNVGSNLTYIITSLDSIGDRIGKLPETQAQVKIESLGEFTRSTMQQLRETIWVINKEVISIEELSEKIKAHISRILAVTPSMRYRVETNGDILMPLKPFVAIHIFRIVQEAVNNSIKHSGATDILVQITKQTDNSLLISINDNGNGFDTSLELSGHYGLLNMRGRTEEMGGTFTLVSTPMSGTQVKLSIPLK